MVDAGSKGFGIVRARSAPPGANAVFLGNTISEARTSWSRAVSELGAWGFYEVPVGTLDNARAHGIAWFHTTPGNAVATSDLTSAAAILGGLGWVLAGAAAGGTAAVTVAEAGGATAAEAGAAGAAGGGAAATAAKYVSGALSNLGSLAAAGGIAALLVDPHFLFRMLKIVGGLALAYIGVKQLAAVGGSRG
jgi:hypothetical protein